MIAASDYCLIFCYTVFKKVISSEHRTIVHMYLLSIVNIFGCKLNVTKIYYTYNSGVHLSIHILSLLFAGINCGGGVAKWGTSHPGIF